MLVECSHEFMVFMGNLGKFRAGRIFAAQKAAVVQSIDGFAGTRVLDLSFGRNTTAVLFCCHLVLFEVERLYRCGPLPYRAFEAEARIQKGSVPVYRTDSAGNHLLLTFSSATDECLRHDGISCSTPSNDSTVKDPRYTNNRIPEPKLLPHHDLRFKFCFQSNLLASQLSTRTRSLLHQLARNRSRKTPSDLRSLLSHYLPLYEPPFVLRVPERALNRRVSLS
jgi:hypothetical protein